MDSLLQSNLACFYKQECIDKLRYHLFPSLPMEVLALDSSLPTNYTKHSTINELINNLMIEQWNVSVTYENYYNHCQPTECSYTIMTRQNVIYIVINLFVIGFFLNIILQFLVLRLVKLIMYWFGKSRINVES